MPVQVDNSGKQAKLHSVEESLLGVHKQHVKTMYCLTQKNTVDSLTHG